MTSPRTVVIVGGVAGGMSAATRLRRNDEAAHIIVLERGEHVSFANCGLPYYVGGVIESRDELLLQTPEALAARFAIDVRIRHEAQSIDTGARAVTVHDLDSDARETLQYDALVLAPGASPFVPDIPGIERALTLRDVADVDAMAAAVASRPRSAVILGGGFIGLEVAENLVARGIDVTIVELADQILAPLDPEIAYVVAEHLIDHGVHVRTGVSAVSIDHDTVTLSTGELLDAGLVIAAIGVRPESSLASDAGLRVGARGGIVVDEHQRTSDPDIYAVGDAAEKIDAIDGSSTLVPLAQTANRHGRLVADVICGRNVSSPPVLGTAVVGVFGLTVATTGWNEKRLRAARRSHHVIHTHPNNHAGYYPGAEAMSLKLLIDAGTYEILGAQGVGGAGVDKRIDIIATAIQGGLPAPELANLELAYAPQFGSAKDPINMLGFIADNVSAGVIRTVQWHELDTALAAGATLIDVRDPDEFAAGAIPDAINIPVDELRARLSELPIGPIIVHCEVGVRANVASRLLAHHGKDVSALDGSYRTWRAGIASQATVPTTISA